jgi:3-dehydroquinate synthase
MEHIAVNFPGGQYAIVVRAGALAALPPAIQREHLSGHVVIATDTTVAPLYALRLQAQLPHAAVITMPDGEQHKNLDTVRQLYDQLVAAGADRHTTVVALGGGVVGDTVGFAAATYMRGVRLVQVPTTLLAMVDSSVGGKVGVDIPQGKNLVGAFKQPEVVLIDPEVLATLPPTQWRAGMAEVIKHGLIADEGLLDASLHTPERAVELITRAVRVKVRVVEEDPYEHSVRAYLNLGHTFGHAIEQVTQYAWLHGYAVAVGMVAAARLSLRLGLCDHALVDRVEAVLNALGLPTRLGDLPAEALYAAMATDKKWQGGHSRFILLGGVQKPQIVRDVPRDAVIAVLEEMRDE